MSDLLRVLLVEDNPGDADLIEELLPREGATLFEVEVVARLSEALERVGADRFDIILLDLGLPDSDGLATLRAIRRRSAQLPVVVLTGNSDERLALAAIQEDAQDYLVKGQLDENLFVRSIKYAIERKRSQDKLRASETKLRQLYESMMDAYVLVDMSGRITEFNAVYLNMLDYTEEELYRLTYVDITPPRWHTVESRIIEEQVFTRGYSDLYEKEYRRKDGTLVPVELRTVLLKDETGRPSGLWAIIRDISKRKQAEHSLLENEARLRSLLQTIPDMIWLKDAEGIYQACNNMFEQFFGAKESDIVGKTDYDFVNKELADSFRDHDRRVMAEDKPSSGVEWITFASDGRHVLVNTIKTPMYDTEGKFLGVLGISRDITDLQRLEEQLRQAQKMEAIGTLAGGIAHDFNNILTAIIGYGHLALMNMGLDDPQRLNIEHMLGGSNRAAHLTKELLLFSRKQISEKKAVDLNDVIRTVEKFLVRVIGEDINFRMTLYSEPIVVYGDSNQLEQVLMNLATNARDAMTNGGDLVINSEHIILDDGFAAVHGYGKPGRYALLTISDSGEGMDKETSDKIFEPFFTTKEVGKGTGLGLSVVYGIIKQHDGFINVYSEPGAGTTFKIYLPIISSEVHREEIALEEESLARGTETILLAEDDEQVRDLVRAVLEQQGYTVIEAVDGADAMKKFMESTETIHLLLSDLIMPKMNGKEAYDEMKKKQHGLKVIFASGYAPDIVRQKMLLENNTSLIYKPISPHALLTKVRTVLDEGEK
jgi:PAS domain S-box-containing protein